MTTVNTRNQPIAMTHTFTIFKSGTQVLGDATPSATLAPTETPVPSVTETPTPLETITSTPSAAPTPTENLNAQPPLQSGSTVPTVLLITIGFALLIGGALVFIQ